MPEMNDRPMLVSTPPDATYARIVRMVASSAGAPVLGFDRIEDLGLAIDEAFGRLLQVADVRALEFEIAPGDGAVAVIGRGVGGSHEHWPPSDWDDSMEAMVLEALATGVELTAEADPELRFTV